ncbi:MAG: CBS domain-containing protein [Roseiflexaceae bacterium]
MLDLQPFSQLTDGDAITLREALDRQERLVLLRLNADCPRRHFAEVQKLAAMMGGTMRSPLTAMIFALELTHDFNVLPALLIGCVAAHTVTVLLMSCSILTEKVARRGYHLAREYSVDPFTLVRVGEIMDDDRLTIPATMTVAKLSTRIARGDAAVTRHQTLPIVDATERLVGIITRGDLLRRTGSGFPQLYTGAGSRQCAFISHLSRCAGDDALTTMLRNNVGRLPVVSRDEPSRLVGYLGRATILAARLRRIDEEHTRKPGWLQGSAREPAPGDI